MRFVLSRVLLVLLISAALFAGATLFAQQPDVIGLSDFPVPTWPENGVVPASMKENYVFIDLAKNEYVVAYPENLGTDAFAKDGPGRLKINRYELLRNVAPVVTASITATDSSHYKYAYTVENGSSAKQSIDQWVMSLPAAAGSDTVRGPDGWFGLIQKGRTFKLKNPEWIRSGAAAIWSFQKADQVISPGSSRKGFEIESELRPGFAVAYLRKTESVDVKVTTHGNVPKEVKEQMDQVLQLEYNSKTVLTYGPKFDKSTDDHTIAEDFIQGIVTLNRAGILDLNSDFTRNALSELSAIKPGAPMSGLKLTTPPKTPAETGFFNALKVSLRLSN
jgi:hypothetical protein